MQVTLLNVRLSYPHLYKPKAAKGATTAKFSAAFILDKVANATDIVNLKEAIKSVIPAGKKVDRDKICLKDGADKPDTYGENVMFVNATNHKRPRTVDRHKVDVVEEDDVFYGGCYVNAVVTIWWQDNDFGRRVNAGLEVVQFWGDGEAFGRKPVDIDKALPDIDNTAAGARIAKKAPASVDPFD